MIDSNVLEDKSLVVQSRKEKARTLTDVEIDKLRNPTSTSTIKARIEEKIAEHGIHKRAESENLKKIKSSNTIEAKLKPTNNETNTSTTIKRPNSQAMKPPLNP